MAFGEMRYISIKTGATTPKANRIMNENNWATKSKLQVMILFAPSVLMEMYRISPKAMGYVLSGWNWSYTAGLPLMGVIVDRFGPYIVLGVGSLVWGLFTVALPIATSAVPLFLKIGRASCR